MTARPVAARTANRLKDEVYRQMFRLEAQRPSADLQLALALLRAWEALERQPEESEPRQWLRTVCPLCMKMIEALFTAQSESSDSCSFTASGAGGSVP